MRKAHPDFLWFFSIRGLRGLRGSGAFRRALLPGLLEIVRLLRLFAGDEALGSRALLALAAGVEEAGDGEHHRADEVHEQVLHGVDDADIQITAQAQALAVDDDILNALDGHHLIGSGGIQRHGVDRVDDSVLLHIRVEEEVHAELKEFPQHADGHGEAERHQRQEEGRQVEGQPLVVIEQQDHGEAHGGGQEAVEGVEHGVPVGDVHIEGVDLPQDLRREDEAQNGDLQRRRQLDPQLHLEPAGDIQQHDGQNTKERALVVVQEQLADQHHQHQNTQGVKHDKGASVLPQFPRHGLPEVLLLPLFFQFFLFSVHCHQNASSSFVISRAARRAASSSAMSR